MPVGRVILIRGPQSGAPWGFLAGICNGSGRLHRKYCGRPAPRRWPRVVAFDNFSTGQERFIAGALRHPCYRLVRADLLDLDALRVAMAGSEVVFHLAATPTFASAPTTRGRIWNRIPSPRGTSWKPCAPRHPPIAFSSTGSVYGEARDPYAGRLPFPRANLPLRRFQTGRRSPDPGLLRGFRDASHHLPVCFHHGRTVHSWPRVRFYKQLLEHPATYACS